MSTFRKHFRVAWDDREPVDIVTNAWDMAEGTEAASEGQNGTATFHAIYHCLKRYGHNVPPFDQWMDLLDDLSPVDNQSGADRTDPTVPVAYTEELSPSPS